MNTAKGPFYLSAPIAAYVINSDCATLEQASLLLADRYANGQAFAQEHIVDVARDDLLKALREILAINSEDVPTFRKRGGTRQGLSLVVARDAIAKATGG